MNHASHSLLEDLPLIRLLAFVQSHDCSEIACLCDGAIWAVASYSDADGRMNEQIERVGSTLAECRRWLGY